MKVINLYRVCTDFWVFNDKLVMINHAFLIVMDCLQAICQSHCEIMSAADIRDDCHKLRHATDSQRYCRMTPIYGSPTYFYLMQLMGLSFTPAIWHQFIDTEFENISNRERNNIIMHDAMFFSRADLHFDILANLFKALIKFEFKILPKKCHNLRDHFIYMGLTFMLKDEKPSYTWMRENAMQLSISNYQNHSRITGHFMEWLTFCHYS